MGIDDDPRMLGVLLGVMVLLYLASWFVAGPPPGWQAIPEAAPPATALAEQAYPEQGQQLP